MPPVGRPMPEDAKRRISATLKGRTRSPEHCRNLSQSLIGRSFSAETKAKWSANRKGRRLTTAHKEAIRAALTGRKIPLETRHRLSGFGRGRRHTIKSRQRMSSAHLGVPLNPDRVERLRQRRVTPETRAKISAANKGRRWPQRARERVHRKLQALPIELRRARVLPALTASLRANPSSLEVVVRQVLDALGVVYEPSVQIGPYVADMLVPHSRLVIECDGDYWHSRPGALERDMRKDKYLEANGYRVLRLGERVIKAITKQALRELITDAEEV